MRFLLRCGLSVLVVLGCWSQVACGQQSDDGKGLKFVADTLIVQADGSFESDPDVAVLAFDVSVEEKELKTAYAKASQSMQTILQVAQRNGLTKDNIETGVLTITPSYDNGRNRRARSYRVQGHVVLRVQDFTKVGPIMDDSVQDGIADFRSLTYSLVNEEAAKKKAVADAMQRALGRATVALEQTHQKLGAARFVNLEVENMAGAYTFNYDSLSQIEPGLVSYNGNISGGRAKTAPPPPPPVQPEKIKITATVQCVFGIER